MQNCFDVHKMLNIYRCVKGIDSSVAFHNKFEYKHTSYSEIKYTIASAAIYIGIYMYMFRGPENANNTINQINKMENNADSNPDR